MSQAFKDYLAVVASTANGDVKEVDPKSGRKYEGIMIKKLVHDIGARWVLRRPESQPDLYGMPEEY